MTMERVRIKDMRKMKKRKKKLSNYSPKEQYAKRKMS